MAGIRRAARQTSALARQCGARPRGGGYGIAEALIVEAVRIKKNRALKLLALAGEVDTPASNDRMRGLQRAVAERGGAPRQNITTCQRCQASAGTGTAWSRRGWAPGRTRCGRPSR